MRELSVKHAPSAGVTVLLRSSLNVPIEGGQVRESFRLDRALQTIEFLTHQGAKVVLISHINGEKTASLRPVFEYLKKKIALTFVDDIVGDAARAAVKALRAGQVLMLENVRRDAGEESNDEHFARRLASLGEVFVNDDFAAAHRKHASIVGVPKLLPSYAGLQFMAEVEGLTPALSPKSPSLAIIGGAKFVTKEPLIRELLNRYDQVVIVGALANDFFKAQGHEVGRSLVSSSPHIVDLLKNSKVILPTDVTVEGTDGVAVKALADVLPTDTIYDLGPETLARLEPLITKAKTIVWNGPTGKYEKGFTQMTEKVAEAIAASSGHSMVGGGDTIASIQRLNIEKHFTFVSTAGGAMLDFLADNTLPGIEALQKSKKL